MSLLPLAAGVPPPADVVLAHQPLLGALPVAVPALLVVLAVGAVMWRDRHAPPDDDEPPGPTTGSRSGDGGASGSGRPPPGT